MTRRQWLTVFVLLGPIYVGLAWIAYWLWWPLPPTLEVLYSHPLFCDRPCETRDEAKRYQIAEVPSGTPTVWHYLEIRINEIGLGIAETYRFSQDSRLKRMLGGNPPAEKLFSDPMLETPTPLKPLPLALIAGRSSARRMP